jgi:hypothetical protein
LVLLSALLSADPVHSRPRCEVSTKVHEGLPGERRAERQVKALKNEAQIQLGNGRSGGSNNSLMKRGFLNEKEKGGIELSNAMNQLAVPVMVKNAKGQEERVCSAELVKVQREQDEVALQDAQDILFRVHHMDRRISKKSINRLGFWYKLVICSLIGGNFLIFFLRLIASVYNYPGGWAIANLQRQFGGTAGEFRFKRGKVPVAEDFMKSSTLDSESLPVISSILSSGDEQKKGFEDTLGKIMDKSGRNHAGRGGLLDEDAEKGGKQEKGSKEKAEPPLSLEQQKAKKLKRSIAMLNSSDKLVGQDVLAAPEVESTAAASAELSEEYYQYLAHVYGDSIGQHIDLATNTTALSNLDSIGGYSKTFFRERGVDIDTHLRNRNASPFFRQAEKKGMGKEGTAYVTRVLDSAIFDYMAKTKTAIFDKVEEWMNGNTNSGTSPSSSSSDATAAVSAVGATDDDSSWWRYPERRDVYQNQYTRELRSIFGDKGGIEGILFDPKLQNPPCHSDDHDRPTACLSVLNSNLLLDSW